MYPCAKPKDLDFCNTYVDVIYTCMRSVRKPIHYFIKIELLVDPNIVYFICLRTMRLELVFQPKFPSSSDGKTYIFPKA